MGWKDTIKEERPTAKSWKSTITETPLTEPSVGESVLGGLQQGVTMNFADEAKGAIDALLGKTGNLFVPEGGSNPYANKSISENYTAGRDEARKQYEEQAKANPVAFGTGNLAGSVLIPTKGIGSALVQGGSAGLGAGEGDLSGQLKDAGMGAALGGAGAGLAAGASKGVTALSKKFGRGADLAAETASGLNRTQGQREDLAAAIASGKVAPGEAGKILREQGLLGMSSGSTADKIRNYLENKVNPHLASIKNNAADIDPKTLSQRIRDKASKYTDEESRGIKATLENRAKRYDQRVETSPSMYSGASPESIPNIPATEIAAAKTRVGKAVGDFTATSANKQAGKDLYGAYAEELKDAIGRGAGPQSLAKFEDLNRQAHLLIPAEEAATARMSNLDGINPLSLRGAGYGITGGVLGGASAEGDAGDRLKGMALGYMTGKAGRVYGPSAAAKGLGAAEKLLRKGGKFQNGLQKALERGGTTGLNVHHYLMMQKDPEYREHAKETDGDKADTK
jgi:hypothetical protein